MYRKAQKQTGTHRRGQQLQTYRYRGKIGGGSASVVVEKYKQDHGS